MATQRLTRARLEEQGTVVRRSLLAPAVLLAAVVMAPSVLAQGKDARGGVDHPILTRYPGSRIQVYSQVEFAEYPLALGVQKDSPANIQTIEGKVTKIGYVNPEGRSALEIYRNYEQALRGAGFQSLWSCAGNDCGRPMYWQKLNGLSASGSLREARTLVVRGKVGGQTVTIALAVNTVGTTVHFVEAKAMDAGLVTASAAEIAAGLDRDGHMSLYNIYFDTGLSLLKPESKAALEEIASLLRDRPALKLMVVGHTDSVGTLASNMKLSADRAAAVVKALTGTHGIGAERLSGHGAGPLAPVASNRTDDGRARNRRVDLVEQ